MRFQPVVTSLQVVFAAFCASVFVLGLSLFVWSLVLLASLGLLVAFASKFPRTRIAVLVGTLLLLVGFFHIPAWELDARLKPIAERTYRGEMGERDVVGITALAVATGLGGYLFGLDEVASEHLGMFRSGDPVRVRESCFPLEAPAIRDAVAKGGTPVVAVNRPEAHSLALDGAAVVVKGPFGTHSVEVRVPVTYRRGSHRTLFTARGLFGSHRFRLDEGLFWGLQQEGVLHPYEVVWRCTPD